MGATTTSKNWTVLKGKIFSPKLNFYGLIVLIFDNGKNCVDNINLVFSGYSEIHNISLADKWDKFEKTIQDMIYGGNFSQPITMAAMDKIKADTRNNLFATELKDNINKNNLTVLNDMFKHMFSKIINDGNVEIECAFDFLTHEELQQGRVRKDDESTNNESENENLSAPADSRFINGKLILAPIDGKLISNLVVGDTLLLNLIVSSMAENAVIDKLKLRKPDGSPKPVPARIVKIQPYGKGVQLLLNIVENFYVKIIEEERILVKLAKSASAENSGRQAVKPSHKKTGASWVAIGILILIGIIITYIFIFGG